MSEPSFLAYIPDPFGVRTTHYFLCRNGGFPAELAPHEVSEHSDLIISLECAALVDELQRAGLPPPRHLADISDAQRLCVGIPRDEGGERRWDIWAGLARHFSNVDDAKRYRAIFQSRHERPEEAVLKSLIESASVAVKNLWNEIANLLGKSNDLERFMTIEVPVQGIFSYRQYAGVCVDKELVLDLLQEIGDEKYTAYHEVAAALKRSPTGLHFWNIQQYLVNTDVANLSNIKDGGRLREAFKLAAFHSAFARHFLAYIDASRNEAIMRHATGLGDRLHPVFRVMGTVTGRILVSDPYLQQLKRKYRGIISAEPESQLRYLDYSQFEPGIVAFLSKDAQLIQAYNDGDVYTALSERVFGSSEQRSLSKRIYLAFCYGMSAEGIAKLVAGASASEGALAAYRDAITEFFSAFPGLNALRSASESDLAANGYVESQFGNRRYRKDRGPLTAKERRWAVNQRVQATASLIFKEALIGLAEKFGRRDILLPVHDAVLMQFASDSALQENVEAAANLMQSAFVSRCPGIRARVTVGDFS